MRIRENLQKLSDRINLDSKKTGLNINYIKILKNGFIINYYYFNSENYRTKDKEQFFNSKFEMEMWLEFLNSVLI